MAAFNFQLQGTGTVQASLMAKLTVQSNLSVSRTSEKPAELTTAKQELRDLNQQLKREKCLRMQVETETRTLLRLLRLFSTNQKTCKGSQSRLLSAELKSEKTKQDQLCHEILELQQTLQKEQDLSNQGEAENLADFEVMEAVCKEFDRQLRKEKRLGAEAESSKLEAIKIGELLF